jgi:hypothetical protein
MELRRNKMETQKHWFILTFIEELNNRYREVYYASESRNITKDDFEGLKGAFGIHNGYLVGSVYMGYMTDTEFNGN